MKLLAIDGNSIINRAFYAIRPLSTKDGLFTNGIFGFMNILLRLQHDVQPDGIAVAFDLKAPTFRHQMYSQYVEGAATVTKTEAQPQTTNGTATEASGTDLTGWVSMENGTVSFSLADAAAYRTAGASKAMPGFDVIDYGQEDYVFGTAEQDARHWDSVLLDIFETYADVLAPLFNNGGAS